ncbi:Hpt domain-containing protein [Solidesulfovibrio carbinolicus]|uniref:Hpt domain-containing protein n=1 Tax=Solidesulfovibrio carbinolicus TaxID=296842 RepID=A0A4P6HSL1_9BACT|nr:Hpt domain-containing protein [Solidesulfovibrio carbinolicus]QAZ68378.1 Hpt domain-containing protein [Solidesulfovibrio carbinolicus]
MTAEHPLLDLAKLRERFDNDDELLAEIFAVFASEAPGRRSGMEAALAAGDLANLAGMAHSLKGVAATMFAEPLRQAAYALELAARDGDAPAAAVALPVVLERLAAVVACLPG